MLSPIISYYFNDHLGAPILQTDATGTVVWRVERDPYGERYATRVGADRHQPLGLPGQEYDASSDRQYNIFRWYRAGWGRYTQADPIGLQGGANLYRYVEGNPVRFRDPLGLKICVVLTYRPYIQLGALWAGAISHAAFYTDGQCDGPCDGPTQFIFDPGGTYVPDRPGKRWGSDLWENPNIEDYLDYHRRSGAKVDVYCFDTSCCEEQQIFDRISNLGPRTGGTCTFNVSDALNDVGPFKDLGRWPGPLSRSIRRLAGR
jgi:RHS repeat-associated protein